jgi:hypothetical protein
LFFTKGRFDGTGLGGDGGVSATAAGEAMGLDDTVDLAFTEAEGFTDRPGSMGGVEIEFCDFGNGFSAVKGAHHDSTTEIRVVGGWSAR